jgi:hypothetical protein
MPSFEVPMRYDKVRPDDGLCKDFGIIRSAETIITGQISRQSFPVNDVLSIFILKNAIQR